MLPKTIWIVLRCPISELPPVISLVIALLESTPYRVALISPCSANAFFGDRGRYAEYVMNKGNFYNLMPKVAGYVQYRQHATRVLRDLAKRTDLIWFGSLDSALAMRGSPLLDKIPYILQLHELYDTHPRRLDLIKPVAQGARAVVVPEKNRAHILQVWLDLKKTPVVIPNKPYHHPRRRHIAPTCPEVKGVIEKYRSDRKVIIYQGHLSEDRDLMPVAEAMSFLPDCSLWLMGKDHGFAKRLTGVSSNIRYLGYIAPPYHLEVTSYADIGVMLYSPVSLNNVFCAPNKIWEYSGFSIPFVASRLPSLEQFSGGVLLSNMDPKCISLDIQEVFDRYEYYSELAASDYDSFAYNDAIASLVESAKC